MLSELHIRNFRLFEDLHLTGLCQVNLFAGKNNTGKTALLEALRIYAAQGEDTIVNHILKQRGEFTPSWASSYDALFNRRLLREDKEKQVLQINELYILGKS